MDKIVENHYTRNIYFLSVIGLGPYTNTTIRRIQNIVCISIFVFHIIPEIRAFVTAKYTLQVILFNMSPMLIGLTSLHKYCTFWYHIGTVKEIMERIKLDWHMITDDDEIKIIEVHTKFGKNLTKVFAYTICPSAGALIISQFTSNILDILIPLNETRPHELPILFECFIDEKKYFYLIAFYFDIMVILITIIFVSTESIFVMWLQHVCALYAIVGHRIRYAFIDNYCDNPITNREKYTYANEALTRAVYMHRRAIEFFEHLKTSFMTSYWVLVILGITSLSINLFRVSELLRQLYEIKELLVSVLFVFSMMGYMLYINYICQKCIDYYNNIFYESYHTKWYKGSLSAQKILLFIMLRSTKTNPFELTGIINLSFNGFSQLLKMSISYFTTILACK